MTDRTTTANEGFAAVSRPNPVEADAPVTRIEGEIPRELAGTLYRNGPNQHVAPQAGVRALHFFDGDALVQAIRFEDGQAHHLGRYARTESYLRNAAENAYVVGGLSVKADRVVEPPVPGHSPNTNIVPHGGRLFAMAENMPPFEMDPETLESKGMWDYDGKMLGMSTTAHPKIDGKTGQMWIHGYQPVAPFIQLYCVEPDGSVSLAEAHDADWPSMMHDFAITENHVIFPLGSMLFDFERMMAGARFGEVLRELDRPMTFGIRRREPGSEIRWFEAPSAGYMFHPGNAYEEDGKIFMDACTYESPANLIASLDGARDAQVGTGLDAHPYLYEFDLEAGTCKETRFSDSTCEFPRIDDRLVGHKNRWGYAATAEPDDGALGFARRITKYDRQGGASVHRADVDGQWVGEPVFVPRHETAAEDEGFVLFPVFDATRDETAIEILDARAVDAEPLARCWLDTRMPFGFHGNWAGR
ncbi:MAG: carotenoid oxygenase family protein [Myxococcota bacterium]|nr:carotenoid oxygenase family protein [Myxococcota bacterium]